MRGGAGVLSDMALGRARGHHSGRRHFNYGDTGSILSHQTTLRIHTFNIVSVDSASG